ncbi:MAG: Ig-like domain-containing protein, partial [Aquabacterium sp.]|nr:Ig-like domain-containing protein [Aquabacterium sp.]
HGTVENVTSSATASVANVNDAATGSVTVTGTATQGQTLTASNNIADADGLGAITYHWLRDGVDTGSTGTTYVLLEADVGTAVSARATYTDGHGTVENVTSSATASVANVNDAATGSVTVTGTATQGQTLTASNNISDADGLGVITYHWLRDGVDTGSTGTTYVLLEADVGTVVSARATYTDGHGTVENVTSSATASVANVNDAATGSVTVTGTATQGQTLTASNNIADADGLGTITYHWLRDGVDTGLTGTTYVLAGADVGTTISARASYTDGHNTAETVTSQSTQPITQANVNVAPQLPTGSLFTITTGAASWTQATLLSGATDQDGDALTVVLVDSCQHGILTINPDGSIQYRSTDGFAGTDSFTYQAFDGQLGSIARRVDIMVIAISPPAPPAVVDEPEVEPPVELTKPDKPVAPPVVKPAAPTVIQAVDKPAVTTPTNQDETLLTQTQPGGGQGTGRSTTHTYVSTRPVVTLPQLVAYNINPAWVPSAAASPLIQLLDLIQSKQAPQLDDINLRITPLGDFGHALPSSSLLGTQLGGESKDAKNIQLTRTATYSTGLGLSIGTIWWTARMSGLVTSALISAPAWRSFDPLPVITSPAGDGDGTDGDLDDREIDNMFDADSPMEEDMPVIQ